MHSDAMQTLVELTTSLQHAASLEDMLHLLAGATAQLAAVERVSVRLLDESRTRLLVSARAGDPLHTRDDVAFAVGEGLVGWVAGANTVLRVADAEHDARFALRPGQTNPLGSFLGVPIREREECIGVLAAVHPHEGYFTEEHERLMVVAAGICAPQIQVARLRRLAQIDPLTGVLNRRGFEDALLGTGYDPSTLPTSVALVDVDHFKSINDRFGHGVGDEALNAVVRLVSTVVRRDDRVARRGGDEFVVLLPATDVADAWRIADRARTTIESHQMVLAPGVLQLTVSIGVAERRDGESLDAWLARADEALYEAKRAGRNRVEGARGPGQQRNAPSPRA